MEKKKSLSQKEEIHTIFSPLIETDSYSFQTISVTSVYFSAAKSHIHRKFYFFNTLLFFSATTPPAHAAATNNAHRPA